MTQAYRPFSNGSSFMDWMARNCDLCRRRGCGAGERLRRCGDLTDAHAKRIGASTRVQEYGQATQGFATMPPRCAGLLLVAKRRDPGKKTLPLFSEGL